MHVGGQGVQGGGPGSAGWGARRVGGAYKKNVLWGLA